MDSTWGSSANFGSFFGKIPVLPSLKTSSLPLKINGWLEDVFPDGSIVPFEGTFARFPGVYLSKGEEVGFAGFA